VRSNATVFYKGLIVGYVFLYLAFLIVELNFQDAFTTKVSEYKSSINPGLNVTFRTWTILMLTQWAALITSLVGMWFFWRPSRWLLLFAILLGYSMGYIVENGPVVISPISSDLGSVSDLCLGALLALSFIGPIADRFRSVSIGKNAA